MASFFSQLGRSLGQINSGLNAINNVTSSLGINLPTNKIQNTINTVQTVSGLVRNPREVLQTVQQSIEQAGIRTFEDALSNRLPSISNFGDLSRNISVLSPELGNAVGKINQLTGSISQVGNLLNQTGISGLGNQLGNALDNFGNDLRSNLGNALSGVFDNISLGTFGGLTGGSSNPFSSLSNSVNANSTSRVPNPLRSYASYNYLLAIGCLSKGELNTPASTYRSYGLNKVIVRSAGNTQNRVTTAAEDVYGAHAEYYIDDLNIESVLLHNNNTGVATGTSITFKIIEPYSMGQFIEALAIAAVEADDYQNYVDAPYCLEIKFTGWDDNGNHLPDPSIPPKYIPFRFVNVTFNVTGEGSVYECEAVPYNEETVFDEIATIRQDTSIEGRTVADILQNEPDRSLTEIINQRLITQEEEGVVPKHNRYIIAFPTTKDGITKAVDGAQRNIQNFAQVDPGIQQAIRASGTIPSKSVYETLKGYAKSNINIIGQQILVEDVFEDGDHPVGEADQCIAPDDPFSIVVRSSGPLQMQDFLRKIQYTNGDHIIDIISDVIINSKYGRDLADKPATNGKKEWFKIDTYTFLEPSRVSEQQLGGDPKVYVYSVVPYFVDEVLFKGPDRRPTNTEGLRALALKTYNYLYSGLNEDVLDFDIQYDFAFFQNLTADLSQLGAERRAGATTEVINPGKQPNTTIAPPGVGAGPANSPFEAGGRLVENTWRGYYGAGGRRFSETTATKLNIAQAFHNSLINSNVDMISSTLTIWGDPYYIPNSGLGNYIASPAQPFINTDGTIDYQTTEVFIIINFRLPFDYNQDTGDMQFSEIVTDFSGLYKVLSVKSTFADGKFTNTLELIRRRSQTDPETGDTENIRLDSEVDLSQGGNNGYQGAGGAVGTPGPAQAGSSPGAPSATPSSPTSVSGAGTAGQIAPAPGSISARERAAMDYYISRGFTPAQAAGIVGNLVNESGLSTRAVNRGDGRDGSDSIGVAQWNSTRAENLRRFAAEQGRSVEDFNTQLEFVIRELNTTESRANTLLRQATTPTEAAVAFSNFERYAGYQQGLQGSETKERAADAGRILREYGGSSQ